jgi:MFS family permease
MLLLGLGFALAFPSINAQATAGVAEHEQGLASGLVNTSIQVGGAVVLAIVTAIIGDNSQSAPGQLIHGMTATIALVVGVSALGLILTAGAIVAKRRAARLVAVADVPASVPLDAASDVPLDVASDVPLDVASDVRLHDLVPCEAC